MAIATLLIALTSALTPKVAVVGPTGKVGRLAVQRLVQSGYTARVLLRHSPAGAAPSSSEDASPAAVAAWLSTLDGVEMVQGDVTDAASLAVLMDGCTACLAMHGARRIRKMSDLWRDPTLDAAHAKNVNYRGVENIIGAARASGTCKRIVRITGKGETPWSVFSILLNFMGSMAKAWNYEGERLLRGCDGLEYTIIRPGVMRGDASDLAAASLALADNGGDLKVASIPHDAIADLCVRSLSYPNAGRSTLCAMTVPTGEGADDWAPLLRRVRADSRSFRGDDLLKEHFTAVRVGGAAFVAIALAAVLSAGALLLTMAKAVVAAVAAAGLRLR